VLSFLNSNNLFDLQIRLLSLFTFDVNYTLFVLVDILLDSLVNVDIIFVTLVEKTKSKESVFNSINVLESNNNKNWLVFKRNIQFYFVINNFEAFFKEYVFVNNVFVVVKNVYKNKIKCCYKILKFRCELNTYEIIKNINRVITI